MQISDDSDVQILRYRVTDEWTDKRDSLGLNRLIAERPKIRLEHFLRLKCKDKDISGHTYVRADVIP